MTVEQIELRKILTQMLADNGINRETNMDSLVRTTIQNTINRTISDEVSWNVRRVLGRVSISIETHGNFRGEADGKAD